MSDETLISWCDSTFNGWIGCTKKSPGCVNCYAELLMDTRWNKVEWGPTGTRSRTSPATWKNPLRWNNQLYCECPQCGWRGVYNKSRICLNCNCYMETRNPVRRRVFAHSLSDVFEDRPELIPWQQDLFQLWHDTPRLDWLVLTKDPAHMLTLTPPAGFPSNVALGVSVENDEWAYKRIPFLLQSKAKVKFVSVEPMLGALDLTPYLGGLSWVICGSESGNSRRPFDVALAEYLYHQCDQAGVKFYMKQGSALKPGQQGEIPDWLWKIKQFPVFGGKIDVGSV